MRPDFSTLVIGAREPDRHARKKRVAVALRFLPSSSEYISEDEMQLHNTDLILFDSGPINSFVKWWLYLFPST